MSNSTSANESTANCTSVTLQCPVEATIYGYYPSLSANAFFCAYFATFTVLNLILAYRYKTRTFGRFVAIGCLIEVIGYIDLYTYNCSTLFAAAIYITLKHMVYAIGPQFSFIRTSLLPWIFITCDILSLLLQAAGGALAASANTPSGSALGGNIMLAGIVFQVVTFTFLYSFTATFVWNLRRRYNTLERGAEIILYSRDFRIFVSSIFVASLFVYARCVYRIAELAAGWANQVMRNEAEFIALDGVMCCAAVLLLTTACPGVYFKSMIPIKKGEVQTSCDITEEV